MPFDDSGPRGGRRQPSYNVLGTGAQLTAMREREMAGGGDSRIVVVNSGESCVGKRPREHIDDHPAGNPNPRFVLRAMRVVAPGSATGEDIRMPWTSQGFDGTPQQAATRRMTSEAVLGALLRTQQAQGDAWLDSCGWATRATPCSP